jgi:hypothetical protein
VNWQQVTVKPETAAALTATPVMLLSGSAADLHAASSQRGRSTTGSTGCGVTPRSAAAEFSSAELGFARSGWRAW